MMNRRKVYRSLVGSAVWVCVWSGLTAFAITNKSPATLFSLPFDPSTSKITLSPGARWGLFRESDQIVIQTTDNSAIRVLNIDGNVVYNGAPTSFTLARGHYFVECNGDRTQFCVLPNDYAGASFLGTEADQGSDSALTERLRQIQPNWVRVMGSSQWTTVQPQQGVWNWAAADQAVAANAGRQIILMAFERPDWVTDAEFISHFTDYVREMARRYDGKIRAIEIWNEPWYTGDVTYRIPGADFVQMLQFYVQMLGEARTAIKSVSSSIEVFGPAWQLPYWSDATEQFVNEGGLPLIEAYTFHDYISGDFPPDHDTPVVDWALPRIDKRIAEHRAFLGNTPILVDEAGLYGKSALGAPNSASSAMYLSNLDWYHGMCRAVKDVIMYRGAGVQAIMPHLFALFNQYPVANYEIFGWDYSAAGPAAPRGPHPKTSAVLMSCYWLNNATFIDYRVPGSNAFLYAWRTTNNTSLVTAWALEGQTAPLQTNGLAPATDIYGRAASITALTEEPVLFRSNDSDPLTLLNAVRAHLNGVSNRAPVFDPLPTLSAVAGQPLQFTISATDPDNDPITYSASVLPPGASFDPATRTFSWTPSPGASGPYTVSFVASDGLGGSDSLTTTVTVLGTLFDGLLSHWKFDEPSGTIASDSAGSYPGTLQNFGFNSTSGWVAGINGNALSFDGVDDYVNIDNSQFNLTNNFTLTTWLYPRDPSGAGAFFSARSAYQLSGFRFFIANNSLLVQGQTTAGWQGTVFGNGTIQSGNWYHVAIVYDQSVMMAYINGVYQGSVDWGGDLVMSPSYTSQIGAESSGHYFNGVVDELMIFGRILTSQQVQSLLALNNAAPILALVGAKSVIAGQQLNFNLSATGGNVASRTFSANPLPAGATMNATSGAFAWLPTLSQVGAYGINFAVSDGAATASQAVLITVTKTNAVPVLGPVGSSQVAAGQTLALAVSATDADGDALTYSASPLPSGAAFNTATGALSWTPLTSQVGSYNVAFGVSDGKTNVSQTASITVTTVITANTPPVLGPVGSSQVAVGQTLALAVSATDADGDALTYSASPLPSGAAFDAATGALSWTPQASQVGSYNVTLGVSDGITSVSQTASITVTTVITANTPPVLNPIKPKRVRAGRRVRIALKAKDRDRDALTYSIDPLPAGATFDPIRRRFEWTPTDGQIGQYALTGRASDGHFTSSQPFSITVY